MSDLSKLEELAKDALKNTKNAVVSTYGKVMRKINGNDRKYFNSNKKGEIIEWKNGLHSLDKNEVKNAVKSVIAAMTIGTDVSSLFPDVLSCMSSESLEIKKLVYLYLINYAKDKPELSILAVNTFVRDTEHESPLIRALALRTMSCIRVKDMIEYLVIVLGRCIDDKDPYVRKTAAICVAKFYDMDPERAEDENFIERLRKMIGDTSPMVVANAVAALSEIKETYGEDRDPLRLKPKLVIKLLAALNECSEWGQVYILDCLATYIPQDEDEAENIVEKTLPRLQHVNAAVILGAVKVILLNVEDISEELAKTALNKMARALVTLATDECPELRYVALRNLRLIVQKVPNLLSKNIQVFFCKYNDPLYVKMEKIELLISLATPRFVERILAELKEYATEADIEFVRTSVRAIGRCAIKVESSCDRCVNVLLYLLQSKVNYVVQESISVMKDIFRKYPNKYESVIAPMCNALESLDEPNAKSSMIWILGEYVDIIDNVADILDNMIDNFHEETPQVQEQLITAIIKLFLKRPNEAESLVSSVLTMATEECTNPDIRDKAYIYWRLLSTYPDVAKKMVFCELPAVNFRFEEIIDDDTLQELLEEIGSVASVYHKPASTFITAKRGPPPTDISKLEAQEESIDILNSDEEEDDDDDLDIDMEEQPKKSKKPTQQSTVEEEEEEEEEEDDDIFEVQTPKKSKARDDIDDLLGF
ncbi:hypothetical protein WA158_005543 [Blastocystis sp. Blastoise]